MEKHFKILENDDLDLPVLVMRDRDEDGNDFVRVITYLYKEGDTFIYETKYDMDESLITSFIDDFSTKHAMTFIDKFVEK